MQDSELNQRLEEKLKKMKVNLSDYSKYLISRNPLDVEVMHGNSFRIAGLRERFILEDILDSGYTLEKCDDVVCGRELLGFIKMMGFNRIFTLLGSELKGVNGLENESVYLAFKIKDKYSFMHRVMFYNES